MPVIDGGYKFVNTGSLPLTKKPYFVPPIIWSAVNRSTSFSIYPLGDSAITIDLGNCIDEQLNRQALAIHDWLQARRFPGLVDIIIAYSSVSVLYDPTVVRTSKRNEPGGAYHWLNGLLEQAGKEILGAAIARGQTAEGTAEHEVKGHSFRIPVCYDGDYGPDLEWVARQKGLSVEEVIRIHYSGSYRIYMIGFLPGFPYMGKLNSRLEIPRKDRPVSVMRGGVGIAGIQTGIYPLSSPGGWQIIGRTPVRLFDWQADPPIRFQCGDQVEFYPISREEFLDWKNP
jgi:inhibitor of KinA